MNPFRITVLGTLFALLLPSGAFLYAEDAGARPGEQSHGRNVLWITLDGLRWQELFGGIDSRLLDDSQSVRDLETVSKRFLRPTARERREALLPFLTTVVLRDGVLWGNPDESTRGIVTNNRFFSYPGYNEILCGFADPGIDSNDKKYNENKTVLEWLHERPEFHSRVAAFCSWDAFPFIINDKRSGIPVSAGWFPESDLKQFAAENESLRKQLRLIDDLSAEFPSPWPTVRWDYLTFLTAEAYLKAKHPRIVFVSLGETDDWAHDGRYDLYLDAAHRNDDYIARLWRTMQGIPQYRDKTTLIVTTDHGRGDGRETWKTHGVEVPGSELIWFAALGPDVDSQAKGEFPFTQSQVAATVARSLGFDYHADVPQAASSLPIFRDGQAIASKVFPSDVIDLARWRLALPVDEDDNGRADQLEPQELVGFAMPPFFHVDETAQRVFFRAFCGGATTKNSSYPRSELREMKDDGKTAAAWSTADSRRHSMQMRVAVTALPQHKPHVVLAQIHDADNDVLMIRLEKKRLMIEREGMQDLIIDKDYSLGTEFDLSITVVDGVIKVEYNHERVLDWRTNRSGCYFKAGCYTQSNVAKGDQPDAFGEVAIRSLSLN